MQNRQDSIDTITPSSTGFFSIVTRSAGGLLDALLTWQDRARERHALAAMDEHALKDLGLTKVDVEMELSKPFWRS